MAGQLVGVAVAVELLVAGTRRAGLTIGVPAAAAFAGLLFFAVVGVASLRESWHRLDLQRTSNAHLSAVGARNVCTVTGPDPDVVAFVVRTIPEHGRFYVPFSPTLVTGGGTCLRFLLLPRLQVPRLADAHYVLFWSGAGEPLLRELRGRGAVVSTYRRVYHIARLPGA